MKITSHGSQIKRLVVTGAIFSLTFAMAGLPARLCSAANWGQPDTVHAKAATGVDGLIAHLHEELKITPSQETRFQKLADVMRENAETMGSLAKSRADSAKTMTAMDDLQSYAEISEAHAEGSKKMIAAFQPLYDSMSDDQKTIADREFRDHYSTHHRGKP